MTSARIPAGERQALEWLEQAERRAILPVRFTMLALTALIWGWSHDWNAPQTEVFVLFFGFAVAVAFSAYVLLLRRLEPWQIRPFSIFNLVIDGFFIAGLFHLDVHSGLEQRISSEYYIFFFLLVLRGYAVLQRRRDLFTLNAVVLLVFVFIFLVAQPTPNPFDMDSATLRSLSVKTSLILLVMALSWFLLGTLGRQRTELLEVREKLLRTENLATLGEIVAGVAHEINNPVGIIMAYSEFLLKKAGDQSELSEDFQVIRSEAKRCQQIIGQLLSFANPTLSDVKVANLAEINEEVMHFLFLDKKNNLIDIQLDIAPSLPNVAVDPVQVKQALLNIYMNARHAMGEEGQIAVTCEIDPDHRRKVRLKIRDTGPGIPPNAMDHMFEPFYTSRDGGTGLGLAITRRIIEAHDGTIEAANAEEGGAVFTIRLPVASR